MEISSKQMSLKYSAVQAGYWMGFCVAFSFAAVMLQARGYSNAELGAIMALGNAAGLLLSPALAARLDSSKRFTVFHALWALQLLQLVLLTSFALIPGRSAAISVIFAIYIAFELCINPINTQLYNLLELKGIHINYGAARGTGSISFAAISALLGMLAGRFGAEALPIAGLALIFFRCAALLSVQLRLKGSTAGAAPRAAQAPASRSVFEFMRGEPRFCGLLFGIAMLFFSHNIATNFMINVVRNVGGGEADMGWLNAFMAATEVPMMFMYELLTRRVRCPATLRFAAVVFVVKSAAWALAANMPLLYAASALQSISYAIVIPASVRYVNLYIAPQDQAKGQALAAGMTSLGTIFASCFGGILYDIVSVRTTLLVGTAAAALGAALCLLCTERR